MDENSEIAYYLEGVASYFLDNIDEARELMNKSLEKEPDYYLALYGLYRIFELQGNDESAYDALVKMAEIFPVN